MNGWRYEWVRDLPLEVYEVLIEEMRAQYDAAQED